jgi:hypothetical protein
MEKPACPYCGSNANERFGLNLEYDQCALIPTNSGSNKCVLINGSYNLYLTKIARDKPRFGCSVHTEKNIIRFAKRSEKLEKTSQEIQIKAYVKSGAVEKLSSGNAKGSVEPLWETHFKNTVYLGAKGMIKTYAPFNK